MNRFDFNGLVKALKGKSFKSLRFKPTKLGNFDGVRDWKVVGFWLAEMKDYFHVTKIGQHLVVKLAQSYLKGYASTWWKTMKQEERKTHGYT